MKQFAYMFLTMILLCGLIFLVKQCEVRRLTKTITAYEAALDSCINAEPQRDTLWLFKTLKDTIRLTTDNYIVTGADTVHDTVIETREYKGNWNNDFIAVRWRAVVFGELKSLEILPTSSYRYPQITLTRTVALPARENENVQLSRERSHLYMTGGIGYYKANDMLFNIGLQWIHRRGWGAMGSVTLDNEGKFYWGGNLIFRVSR